MQQTQQAISQVPDKSYEDFDEGMKFSISDVWSFVTDKVKSAYGKAANSIDDEFSLPVSQEQVNGALKSLSQTT